MKTCAICQRKGEDVETYTDHWGGSFNAHARCVGRWLVYGAETWIARSASRGRMRPSEGVRDDLVSCGCAGADAEGERQCMNCGWFRQQIDHAIRIAWVAAEAMAMTLLIAVWLAWDVAWATVGEWTARTPREWVRREGGWERAERPLPDLLGRCAEGVAHEARPMARVVRGGVSEAASLALALVPDVRWASLISSIRRTSNGSARCWRTGRERSGRTRRARSTRRAGGGGGRTTRGTRTGRTTSVSGRSTSSTRRRGRSTT